MKVHLVDGTYELFRHFFAVPERKRKDGTDVGATLGVVRSMLAMIKDGATHVGIATDHVIESFRNDLYSGYKTGEGLPRALTDQFPILEDALADAGFTVWPMVEFEADDALAAAARVAGNTTGVEQVIICTPDKDLAQCVQNDRIVQLDRRKNEIRNEGGVIERFGVKPTSIPDWLALVGDSADGYPGIPGWGKTAASTVLAAYGSIDRIPSDPATWTVKVRGAGTLSATLEERRDEAALYRTLATLRTDPVVGSVKEWTFKGTAERLAAVAGDLGVESLK